MNKLDNQVKANRRRFRVDHFDMVISEYIERNNRNELVLDPPYQRLFRWIDIAQSQLIESILIGIPLPPIFVFQNEDYNWEIIDGVQRTNTLINILSTDSEKVFQGCEIITELNGKTFKELPDGLQRIVRNTRLRIEVVEETDDIFSQYLLFSRLNSNGEKLEGQEIRNFLIYKLNKNFYNTLQNISIENVFLNCLKLAKNKVKEKERINKQENVEYALKFFIGRELANCENISKYDNIDELVTRETEKYLKKYDDIYLKNEYLIFEETFNLIFDVFGENSFKYYHKKINNIANTFSISVGISYVINSLKTFENRNERIKDTVKKYFDSERYKKITASSYSPTRRMYELNKYSKDFFQGEFN